MRLLSQRDRHCIAVLIKVRARWLYSIGVVECPCLWLGWYFLISSVVPLATERRCLLIAQAERLSSLLCLDDETAGKLLVPAFVFIVIIFKCGNKRWNGGLPSLPSERNLFYRWTELCLVDKWRPDESDISFATKLWVFSRFCNEREICRWARVVV